MASNPNLLPPPARRLVLTVHVVVSVGWIGVDAVLLALGVIGLGSDDPQLVRAAYLMAGWVGTVFVAPVSLAALVSGVVLAAGTRWGLVRHYWVLLSLVATAGMTAAAIAVLVPGLQQLAGSAAELPAGALPAGLPGPERIRVVVATSVALLLLSAVTGLNVYKPRGRTPIGRRAAARRPDDRAHAAR